MLLQSGHETVNPISQFGASTYAFSAKNNRVRKARKATKASRRRNKHSPKTPKQSRQQSSFQEKPTRVFSQSLASIDEARIKEEVKFLEERFSRLFSDFESRLAEQEKRVAKLKKNWVDLVIVIYSLVYIIAAIPTIKIIILWLITLFHR